MSGAIRFLEMTYSESDLNKWPERDRRYFMMLGQAYNDISILTLLMVANFHRGEEARPLMARKTTTALLCVRMLSGRIWEMHKLIDGEFNRFSRTHEQHAPEARECVAKLRRYLQAPNAVREVRLNAAFHYDQTLMELGFGRLSESELLTDYISDGAGNCTFDGADSLLLLGLGCKLEKVWQTTTPIGAAELLHRLILEVRDAARLSMDVCMQLQRAVYLHHLKDQVDAAGGKTTTLTGQPDASELAHTAFLYGPADERREREAQHAKVDRNQAYRYRAVASPWEQSLLKSDNAKPK